MSPAYLARNHFPVEGQLINDLPCIEPQERQHELQEDT